MIDYGDVPNSNLKKDDDSHRGIALFSKMNSLENTLRSKSIHKLSSSPSDLDQLIGASSALEMADGDTEY